VLKLTFLDALGGVVHKPRANGARPCARNGLFFKQLGLATAQCVASPVTGLVGAGSVVRDYTTTPSLTRPDRPAVTAAVPPPCQVLLSVDATTRKLSGKEETRRMRPPRVFDTKMPQLVSLEDRMVVKLQMVLEGFVPPPVAADAGSSAGLRKGTLMVKVRLLSQLKEGLPTVVQEHRTRAIDWPKVKHWEVRGEAGPVEGRTLAHAGAHRASRLAPAGAAGARARLPRGRHPARALERAGR